jgi:hypothetical protein
MGRFGIGLAAILTVALILGVPVLAQARPARDIASSFENTMRNHQRDMQDAEKVLRDKPQADWTPQELETYLFNALFAVYNANCAYVIMNRRVPESWETLRDLGALKPWPGNPLNNWEPIKWEVAPDKFSPGEIVLQICPPELYSGVDNPTPMTFVISINGPTHDYEPVSAIWYKPYKWATTPPGSVTIAGFYTQPATITRAKRAEARKAREETEK